MATRAEACPATSCGDSPPWRLLFWGCLLATPLAVLSAVVFVHAACTSRIDAHDCGDADGWASLDDIEELHRREDMEEVQRRRGVGRAGGGPPSPDRRAAFLLATPFG